MGVYIPNGRLPSAYQEVEYIQSSGTQYFVVGTSFKTSYKSVIDLEMVTTGGDYVPLGALTNDASKRYGIDAWSSYFKVIAGGSSWSNTISEDKNRHTFILNKSTATVDGTDYSMSYVDYTFSGGIGVFAYHNVTRDICEYNASAKIYKLDIYDENGVHIYDLTPCYRKSDSVIGMYDIINDTFYTNQGTGTFSKGADITMAELKNAYIGEVWTPGANTLAYYNIDANDTTSIIYDKSGNNRNLTWYGTGAYTTDANAGKVADFNGASYASLGGYINPGGTAYTLLVWGKYSSWGNYVSQGSSSSRVSTIAMTATSWTFETPAVSSSWIDFNPTPPADTWELLVGVRDGNSLSIYYNGQLNGQKTDSNIQTNWTSGGYWQLGAVRDSYEFLTGQIKTVIFENKARTADEIAAYYNLTKSNYGL